MEFPFQLFGDYSPYLPLERQPPFITRVDNASLNVGVEPQQLDAPSTIRNCYLSDHEDPGELLTRIFSSVETWLEPTSDFAPRLLFWPGPEIFQWSNAEVFRRVKAMFGSDDWIGCLELDIAAYGRHGQQVWRHYAFLLECPRHSSDSVKYRILEKASQHNDLLCRIIIRPREDLNSTLFYL